MTATEQDASPAAELGLRVGAAAALSIADVLARLGSTADGLSGDEAARRLVAVGPNAVRSHRVQPLMILGRQLRSAVLILLAVTAFVSFFLGERTSTVVIGVILAASVGLGFVNEYRAEKATQALHSRVTHRATTLRDGAPLAVDVTSLVPGDVVRLVLGEVVPADIRLLTETGLECDESVLTGESQPAAKAVSPAVALTSLILVTNLILHRPLIQSLLFSLAIAVGITPQLLPAVVSTSLATGSRRLAKIKVLVKRLVCIEDLGDMDVLVTDKTGTLTEGRLSFTAALDAAGTDSEQAFQLGLLATETDPADGTTGGVGGNPLDSALWGAPGAAEAVAGFVRVGLVPFDHERQMTSAVVRSVDGHEQLVVKGAPESVLTRCPKIPPGAEATLHTQFAAGSRVVAVANRVTAGLITPSVADEKDLTFVGYLVFLDPPKAGAVSLRRLAALGVSVKVCTGDNPLVAEKVCADLGLVSGGTLTGADLIALDDDALTAAAQSTTIFARVSPEQKARLIALLRRRGRAVGFLGDGVNDVLALHAADVGISVDTATDVAKDAADVVLLDKDLDVLADGVSEGRRIFANTIKYVLMGTSSNFGNMFSAAAASAVLSFLPMLPSQILLNNLLYDASQLTIPTDRVDPEQLRAPSHWDIGFIRRFMVFFGPISSLFDFLTFAIMLGVFHAGPDLFRAGWFAESLATQTLVIFAIRTRRSPFTRSRPSLPLLIASLTTVTVGVLLPLSPLSHILGFAHMPVGFFLALVGMVIGYLVLIELAKRLFFADSEGRLPHVRRRGARHRVQRRAARFSVG